MRIRLTALDTLFFRDGKPFNRGEETWANGIFPPPPSVLYGALRSLYFTSNPKDIGKENTNNDPTNDLVISDIQITSDDNLYYTCPLDVVIEKATQNTNNENYLLLNLDKTKRITSSNLDYHLSVSDNLEVETLDGYVSQSNFERKYLKGQTPNDIFSLETFLTLEPKVGIGRDNNTHVSDEGLLYRVGMVRPESQNDKGQFSKLNIEIEFDLKIWNLSIGDKGFIKLGGEAKSCSYEVISSRKEVTIKSFSSDIFKIYFATPTVFNNDKINKKCYGWIPSFLDENLEGEWNGIKVKLLTAAIGKPKYLGGFDMKKRRPKPMIKMIPEGSVYYFKVIDKNDIDKLKNLKQPFVLIDEDEQNTTRKSDKKSNQGFGLAYLSNI
jgi:CRISPR-associated protein Cmr3